MATLSALLVEDEFLVGMLIEDMLGELGVAVVATRPNLQSALVAIERSDFDVAILDLNLNGETSLPAAALLAAKGKPFLFASGYGASGLRDSTITAPVIQKPFQLHELRDALRAVLPRDKTADML